MKLGVNIDHIATLRQARRIVPYPDPVAAVGIVEKAGADQITIHLREDRRHIQESDLFAIRKVVRTSLNLELAAVEEIIEITLRAKPDICTFVPERREEITTEGGLNVIKNFDKLKCYVSRLKANSIKVSMFVDPNAAQIEASKEVGADAVELHTGDYCLNESANEVSKLKEALNCARSCGLYVAAGHGLNYDNIGLLIKEIPDIEEYNIGHSIIARAVFVGLEQAVREMKKITG